MAWWQGVENTYISEPCAGGKAVPLSHHDDLGKTLAPRGVLSLFDLGH